jgi:hypothetical protein
MNRPTDVRCDLCENPAKPVWVFRTDQFAMQFGDEPIYYHKGEEWGVCKRCYDDILADRQAPIMNRRQAAARHEFAGQDLPDGALENLLLLLDMTIASFLASRFKDEPGRAFNWSDNLRAEHSVQERGRDSADRESKPDEWPDEYYVVEVERPQVPE